MSLQPRKDGLTRAVSLGLVIILPAIFFVSCSTTHKGGDQSRPVTAIKSTNPANDKEKDRAAERQRWATRVQQDNTLDSVGSEPGHYGSFGPRFSW